MVTLASLDEDDLICNLCTDGKDRSFFRVTVGSERTGKRRDPVVKRLEMLADFADPAARGTLADKLCDLREATFGSDALDWFCATFGIANARSNYEYIRANDYEHDLVQVVALEHLPAGPKVQRTRPALRHSCDWTSC